MPLGKGGFVVVMPPLRSGDTSRGGLYVVSWLRGVVGGHLGFASVSWVARVVGGCLTGGVRRTPLGGSWCFQASCCVWGSSDFLLFRGWPSVTYCSGWYRGAWGGLRSALGARYGEVAGVVGRLGSSGFGVAARAGGGFCF